jgi:predicted enzyme related to lactoylglutathione lyase
MEKKKVTGVGGVFFRSQNPAELKKWYSEHLGIVSEDWGTMFEFREADNPETKGYLVWSPFPADTKYFDKEYMVNYRVNNITELVSELKEKGVTIVDEIQNTEYGKFVHILDAENNKIELWEPPVQ